MRIRYAAVLLAIAAAGAFWQACAARLLDAPMFVEVGDGPTAVVACDIDGDGDLDLASTDSASDSVSVLIARGDGTFLPHTEYPAGHGPSGIAAGDVNDDGNEDLITANKTGDDISVLLGHGDGTFAPPIHFAAGDSPAGITVADLEGDGDLDCVIANTWAGLSVLLGDGDGTFALPVTYATPHGARNLAAADVDGDGDLDLAAADNYQDGRVAVFLGNGDGTFTHVANYHAAFYPRDVSFADLNGDGKLDMAVARWSYLSAFLGRGDGTFTLPVDSWCSDYGDLALSDVNADGDLDAVVCDEDEGDEQVSVLLGQGDGTFGPGTPYRTGSGGNPSWVVPCDLDGDAAIDLVVADELLDRLVFLGGHGDGTFGVGRLYYQGAASVVMRDLDADGDLDLLTGWPVRTYAGRGDGTLAYPTTYYGLDGHYAITIADVNADGWADAVGSGHANDVSVMLGLGGMAFGDEASYVVGHSANAICSGDVDGDGDVDLVTANELDDDVSFLFSSSGVFSRRVDYPTGDRPVALGLADVSEDGALDLVVVEEDADRVSVHLGVGDGTFAPAAPCATADAPVSLAVSDLNGDGHLDLVTANGGSGYGASVLLGHGDGTFAPQVGYYAGSPWRHVSVGDLDGDGAPDIVVTGAPDVLAVLRGTGDGTFPVLEEYSVTEDPYATALGDLNGDGILDVVVVADATLCVVLGSGSLSPVEGALYASAAAPGIVTIRWTVASLSRITGFNVYRATSSSASSAPQTEYVRLNETPLDAVTPRSYDDDAVWPGATFWYDVRAVIAGGGEEALSGSPVWVTIPGELALALRVRGPSPFAGETSLECDIPPDAPAARLSVYNCRGALVRALMDAPVGSGRRLVAWDGRDGGGHGVASGVYFVRLEAAGEVVTRKVVVLR